MKLIQQLHGRLMNVLKNFTPTIVQPARQLGVATFKKTRFSSHVVFIKTCMRDNIIPNGLRIQHKFAGLPPPLHNRIKSTTARCSRKLMQSYIHHFARQASIASDDIEVNKADLQVSCNLSEYREIRFLIHVLNKELYHALCDIKDRKLHNLCNNTSVPPIDTGTTRVVTIPSDMVLSPNQKALLSKGLRFVPNKSAPPASKVESDMYAFYRRIKLHAHFNDPEKAFVQDDQPDDDFKNIQRKRSTWTPPDGEFSALDTFIKSCSNDVKLLNRQKIHHKSNLSPGELSALRELREDRNCVIRPADKGGAVVVWRKDLYDVEAQRQLSNTTFYEEVTEDATEENNEIVKQVVEEEIQTGSLPSTAENLINKNPRCSKFYLLPKIHKPENPGRPIVSACSCPTELISKYLDSILKPIVSNLPTYIKDTNHCLQLVDSFRFDNISQSRLLFTMDVKSLYTVIPNHDGLKALQHFLDRRDKKEPSTNTLLRLAELVLSLNAFSYDDKYYKQIGGVSMGTRMGPSYACLFVGYIEEQIDNIYTGQKPELLKRFIDDILGATSMELSELKKYIEFVQGFHPALEYTFDITDQSLPFQDITLSIEGYHIATSVHYKPTDTHSYLMYTSCHPPACKNAIPFSQFLRLRRLCSCDDDYRTKAQEMRAFFLARDYPPSVVDKALKKVSKINRDTLLHQNPRSPEHKIPLVLTYHHTVSQIPYVVHKNWHHLSEDDDVGNRFGKRPVTAFRSGRNLKNILMYKDLHEISTPPGTFSCGRRRCVTCPCVINIPTVTGPKSAFKIYHSYSCTSKNVVYCIVCAKCSMLYVGETMRRLGDRFREHLRKIRIKDMSSEVAVHFNTCGHDIDDIRVTVLKSCHTDAERKEFERLMINSLGTIEPYGINRK